MQAVVTEQTAQKLWKPELLPEPSSSFTIPSIHDDTQLECRIYHPRHSSTSIQTPETKAVTIAHPYTPMGGCFDVHVLHAAGLEFLKHGYILGLFNLRGAGASKGHTSWTSKPEQEDYLSFVGFLLYYLDELHQGTANQPSPMSSLTRIVTQVESPSSPHPPQAGSTSSHTGYDFGTSHNERILVLGGYSYGSQIVRQLPDLNTILGRFSKPETGTAAAEIRLRATHLAQERLHDVQMAKPRGRTLTVEACPRNPIYGGDESEPGTRRVSRESRRSIDVVRKTVERSRAHFSKNRASSSETQLSNRDKGTDTLQARTLAAPEIRYLLISPLLPPLAAFLSLSSRWWKPDPIAEQRLSSHQTLAIWGSDDFFTSGKRLTKWALSLQQNGSGERSGVRFQEVLHAGHFWLEHGAVDALRLAVRAWLDDLDGS